jgi:hypothetical protein
MWDGVFREVEAEDAEKTEAKLQTQSILAETCAELCFQETSPDLFPP